MGSCNTVNEKENKIIRANIHQEQGIEGDYIVPEKLANHNDINKKYKLSNAVVGEGATGTVCEGVDKEGNHFAVKRINKMKLRDRKILYNEATISLKVDHPHIIKTYEVFEDLKTVSFIMDLVDGGDLFDFITQSPDGKLTDEDSLNLLIQVLETLDYLHEEMNVCHRDIKPENFLVQVLDNGEPNLKLIDFGFACEIKPGLRDYLGTPTYTAPEIIMRDEYDEKVDIWSTGILLFNMLTGCQPYNSNDYVPLDEQVLNKSIPFSKIENEQLKKLCKKLCVKDPVKRVSAREALELAYDIREEIEKNELHEQFDQLDSKKTGKLPLSTLRSHFKLDLRDKGDDNKLIDFEQFYTMVVDSVKV